MKRWFTIAASILFVGSGFVASDEFFSRTRLGALADAHEAFLAGDHAEVASRIRDAIRDAAGDPEVTRSALALLEELYTAREGRPIPVDWTLHPSFDRLKVSVVRRENGYWTEYGLRVWGKLREAGLVDQIRLTHASGDVVLDRNERRGTWWSLDDAEDGPEFELAFWENNQPPGDGLYDLHVEFTDGAQWDAWLLLSNAVASDTPPVSLPQPGEVLETSRPEFGFEDFRSPEYNRFERRSLWYSLGRRSESRPLFSRWEMHPSRVSFTSEQELPDGDYTMSVFFSEARRFGPVLIDRTAGTLVPFTVRTSGIDPDYSTALQALADGRFDEVSTALDDRLSGPDVANAASRADALRIVAQYELETGRTHQARRHLTEALSLYRETFDDGHPVVQSTRRLLED